MQNKTLSFFGTLLLSAAIITPAFAQDKAAGQQAAQTPATVQSVAPTEKAKTTPAKTTAAEKPATSAPKADIAKRAESAKKALEENLAAPQNATERTAVNFPSRPTLGSIELAPLPGLNDTLVTGPAPVEKSLSKKDLPSEQLLGRITPEVFQEMADLERGNAFLKLQTQKETLRNDLEKLKTQYRESRLAEINKREDIIKERIKWWQEQENQRLLLEKKKQETALIEQQIADAEATRERLRQEALDKRARAQQLAAQQQKAEKSNKKETKAAEKPAKPQIVEQDFKPMKTLYKLVGVKGARGQLKAVLKDTSGNTITVKRGEQLPSGHVVKSITKENIQTTMNGIDDTLAFDTPRSK